MKTLWTLFCFLMVVGFSFAAGGYFQLWLHESPESQERSARWNKWDEDQKYRDICPSCFHVMYSYGGKVPSVEPAYINYRSWDFIHGDAKQSITKSAAICRKCWDKLSERQRFVLCFFVAARDTEKRPWDHSDDGMHDMADWLLACEQAAKFRNYRDYIEHCGFGGVPAKASREEHSK
jgi:hypothetical protein